MYEIAMTTWYQETPEKDYEEIYMDKGFEHMDEACEFLSKHWEKILDDFPVEKIEIRFNKDRTRESQRDERIEKLLR